LTIEKPPLWEYRLFFQVWLDENEKNAKKIYIYQHELRFFQSDILSVTDFGNWAGLKKHEILGYIAGANTLVGQLAQKAFGPLECPGDAREIIDLFNNHLTPPVMVYDTTN
jgi:hypothetical protein